MNKRFVLVVLVVAVAGASAAVFYRPGQAEAGPTLTLAQVTRGDVVDTVQATGTLEAVTTVQVGTQVSGAIKALHADFNSIVRQGQVIAELEPSLFESQVEQSRATLVRLEADLDRAKVQVEDAQQKLQRAKELSGRNLIPESELESAEITARQMQAALRGAEAQIVQSQASLNQSEVNLGHTIIRSPIDGIVISRNVDVGQTVAASMQAPVLYILARDLAEMQVNASVDESDIGRIQRGQAVTFRVDAYPDDVFTGTVSQVRLQPVVTQNVVSYVTMIDVPNRALKLKPGMTATVTVEIARADAALRVPNGALRFQPTPEVFAALGQAMPGTDVAGRGSTAEGPGSAMPATAPGEAAAPGASDVAADAPPAFGGPGGPGGQAGFAQMSPEQREQMRARFQQMSPEERQQFRGARGGGGPMPGGGAAALSPEERQQRRARRAGGEAGAGREGEPQARPMKPIWLLADGRLTQLMVKTGISNGSHTVLLDSDLAAGAQIATGITQPSEASAGSGGNPFMPFGGRRFGGGGGGRR